MLGKVWKRVSEKRPRGAKLIRIVGALSAMVWITAFTIFFLLKNKPQPAAGREHDKARLATVAIGEDADSAAELAGEAATPSAGGPAEARPDKGEAEAAAGSAQPETESKGGAEAEAKTGARVGAQANKEDGKEAEGSQANGSVTSEPAPTREELAALRQVAELFAGSGDMNKAVTPMRRVMRVPTQEPALLALATDIFLATGNYGEALASAKQLLAITPDDIRVRVQAVEAQYRLGKVDKAVADAKALLKLHPGELTMLTALGTIEVEMGPAYPDYGKSLQTALKLKPDYAPALYLLGRKAQLEGDFKDAESAFRKVIKLEPQNAKAHGQLGMALYHLGKANAAETEYRAELAMNPDDYNTWYNLGELLLTVADEKILPNVIRAYRASAMESYLKALELNPDLAQAHYRVGVLLNGNGQYREAIRHLEASLKADSHHVPTLVQLSLAFENLKQPERARAYLTKAYELDPLNKVVLFKLKQWS